MEHSSPLAAMQPPTMFLGHCFRPEPTSYTSCGPQSGIRPSPFNFKDLSMKKGQGDYFGMDPVRGSSPTASLAADLSQNFHIDQSPQLTTPRRSLFSSNLFGKGNGHEDAMTTPPMPSSSPAPPMDVMEMSPLPHKPSFLVSRDTPTAPAKTPLSKCSPMMDSPMASGAPSPLQDSPMLQKENLIERKRPSFLRPSLAKTKAQSFQLGMSRPSPESQAPPFRFSSRTNSKTSLSNSASLEDMFGESPQRERPTLRTHSSGNVPLSGRLGRPFSLNSNSSSNARGCGSPASIRKSGHPMMRPRKLCRRSLSMFEHPDDVIAENEANYTANSPLQAIADVEGTAPSLQLPHAIPEDQGDALPRINKNVLLEVMNGKYNQCFDNVVIIDCRFEYEYEGGHINGAVNYNDKETLAAQLFAEPRPRTALILHCEYSVHRAPIMAKYLRHRDRAFNVDQYPQLCYPDMYILDGGYSAFFAENRSFCYPQNYVEMSAKEHEHACERGLGKVKQRSKLSRAQTYAFGEISPEMQDSPTGRCRNFGPLSATEPLLSSPFSNYDSPAPSRTPGRRMLSY